MAKTYNVRVKLKVVRGNVQGHTLGQTFAVEYRNAKSLSDAERRAKSAYFTGYDGKRGPNSAVVVGSEYAD